MWHKLAWIAASGALGTLSRYALSGTVQRFCGEKFPWGTLAVNAIGCLLFGAVWALAEQRVVISGQTRLIVLTGFMGAFTTFSTFAFEAGELLRDSQWLLAGANLVGQNVLGVTCILVGLAIGRLL
jgi:CrcB protein